MINAEDAAQWATTAALGIGLLITLSRLKTEKSKTAAEAVKLIQEARKTQTEASFIGIKEISEAAAILVVPLKTENVDLRKEVNELRDRVDALEEENRSMKAGMRRKDVELHEERQTRAMMQRAFEERTKALIEEYERDVRELQATIRGQEA